MPLYTIGDEIPDRDDIVGDPPEVPVEVVKDVRTKIVKTSSKAVGLK